MIGAGAIQLGGDQVWRTRLSRNTLDWDFAVRVDSWEQFDLLGDHLTSSEGGFVQGGQRHRFKHVNGRGVIDIVPFGDLEQPEGEIDWGDGFVMNTTGLEVVERNHNIQKLAGFDLHAATIPAILGLKLLAFIDRRERRTTDMDDVYAILLEANERAYDGEDQDMQTRLSEQATGVLSSGQVTIAQVGAFLIGHEVREIFSASAVESMVELLQEVGTTTDRISPQIARGVSGTSLETVRLDLEALSRGLTPPEPDTSEAST